VISFYHSYSGPQLKLYYSKKYLSDKFKRIIIPFLFVFVISLFIGIITGQNYYLGPLSFIGVLPTHGAGNYFVSMAIQFIILAPLMYFLYRKSPGYLLFVAFFINICFEIICPYVSQSPEFQTLYAFCIIRYLFAIALGFAIADTFIQREKVNLAAKKYWFIILLIPISVSYLLMTIIYPGISLFKGNGSIQNVLTFSYALLLVVLFLNYPWRDYTKNRTFSYLSLIGKASYHIYLVQMLYFGIIPITLFSRYVTTQNVYFVGPVVVFADILITVIAGLLFYYVQLIAEKRFIKIRRA